MAQSKINELEFPGGGGISAFQHSYQWERQAEALFPNKENFCSFCSISEHFFSCYQGMLQNANLNTLTCSLPKNR